MSNANPTDIKPVEKPKQFNQPQLTIALVEVDRLVRAAEARQHFQVSGKDLTVAVADTGLNADHVDFAGRVPVQRNFTSDNGDADDDATDGNGHGTNVGGIIVAKKGDHAGTAPGAKIIPLRELCRSG
jgi:subtilisin family serine protease